VARKARGFLVAGDVHLRALVDALLAIDPFDRDAFLGEQASSWATSSASPWKGRWSPVSMSSACMVSRWGFGIAEIILLGSTRRRVLASSPFRVVALDPSVGVEMARTDTAGSGVI